MDVLAGLFYEKGVAVQQFPVKVVTNRKITGGYFTMDFAVDIPRLQNSIADGSESDVAYSMLGTHPGQFVMLRGPWGRDLINGRAFSVLEVQASDRFSILAKVFGRGTQQMSDSEAGTSMTCLGPLGTGFRPAAKDRGMQLLVAGGVGLPPLHLQARMAARQGVSNKVELVYGGRSKEDIVLTDEVRSWGVACTIATEDGSLGIKGRVTEALIARLDALASLNTEVSILSCGPTPMLRAVRQIGLERNVPTYLCLEEQMACGFGACLGCAVPVHGPKPYQYCCTDGPVFSAKELRWS